MSWAHKIKPEIKRRPVDLCAAVDAGFDLGGPMPMGRYLFKTQHPLENCTCMTTQTSSEMLLPRVGAGCVLLLIVLVTEIFMLLFRCPQAKRFLK